MNKVADFNTKYAWPIVIITIVITILAASQLRKLTIEDDITKYIPQNDPDIEFYSDIVDKFGGKQSKTAVISLEYDDLFQVENLRSVKSIIVELNDISDIKP